VVKVVVNGVVVVVLLIVVKGVIIMVVKVARLILVNEVVNIFGLSWFNKL